MAEQEFFAKRVEVAGQIVLKVMERSNLGRAADQKEAEEAAKDIAKVYRIIYDAICEKN